MRLNHIYTIWNFVEQLKKRVGKERGKRLSMTGVEFGNWDE